MTPLAIQDALLRALRPMTFAPPVTHVYNPLIYAKDCMGEYLQRYGAGHKEVVLVGMNPGPFGMAQTGVPFGAVPLVRDWLGIRGAVGKPKVEHPKRPIDGFRCPRTEVSGMRLWGWAKERFGTPQRFFARFMVYNYCPLVFMEESGKNRTPDKLPLAERARLFAACDQALQRLVEYWQPGHVVGVGAFAATRAQQALAQTQVAIGQILHPSPASPLANAGWSVQIEQQMQAMDLLPVRGGELKRAL